MPSPRESVQPLLEAGRLAEARERLVELLGAGGAAEDFALLGLLCGMLGDAGGSEAACRRALELKPAFPEAAANLGIALAAQGKTEDALHAYDRALALNPANAAAHNNRATALNSLGRQNEAEAAYRRAIELKPDYPDAWYNLGNLLTTQRRSDEATECHARALALNPRHVGALNSLGQHHLGRGQTDQALSYLEQALSLAPRHAGTLNNLGNALVARKDLTRALRCLEQAAALDPGDAAVWSNLGLAQLAAVQLGEAEASFRRALDLRPDFAEVWTNLGNLHARADRHTEAERCYREAIRLQPERAEAHANLGMVLHVHGRHEESNASYREALRLEPGHPEAWTNLGVSLHDQGRTEEAIQCYREALKLDPQQAEARLSLGVSLQSQGRLDAALAEYRALLESKPDYTEAHSNLVFALNYSPGVAPEALFTEHRRWAQVQLRGIPVQASHPNDPDPGRRLRIGYVSPDFRGHSVAYFIEPVLEAHDRERHEIFCYSEAGKEDEITARLKHLAHHWRRTRGLSNEQLADRIRADRIDVLVDLAGHTANGRLRVFARRPAPVQLTWLGYCNTTAVPAIGYRLTDALADPPGQEAFHGEELVRLPHGFLCYRPPEAAPEVAPPPGPDAGHVTFGSFNNLAKMNDAVIARWAEILKRVPGSRLLLKNKSLHDPAARAHTTERFAAQGIGPERLELIGWTPTVGDHLLLYNRIDIALDTFPYNGTTTTFEALWMGVPVIALEGNRHAARVGVSILTRLGLEELIAPDAAGYVALAARLTGESQHLRTLRAGLRERLRASPLCDAPGLTRDIEVVYRRLWQGWCTGNGAPAEAERPATSRP